MIQPSRYQIISHLSGNIGPFQDSVGRAMEDGWVPLGSVVFHMGNVYQALILPVTIQNQDQTP